MNNFLIYCSVKYDYISILRLNGFIPRLLPWSFLCCGSSKEFLPLDYSDAYFHAMHDITSLNIV